MNYCFALLVLSLVSLANGYAKPEHNNVPLANAFRGPGHNSTAANDKLNAKIEKEFWQIMVITSLGDNLITSLENWNETLGDIFQGLGRTLCCEFPQKWELLILDRLDGFSADKENYGFEPNWFVPLLPPSQYKQAGEIEGRFRDGINLFMWKLSDRYVKLLQEEGEDKEIYVVPIGLADRDKDMTYPLVIFGVLAKQPGSFNNYTGIAGIAL